MKATPARKQFKNRFGQVNHLLITSLVGIDGIRTGQITQKQDSFSTLWNPKDPVRSADRARIFILKSFLGWAVESLEMYMKEIYKKPKLLHSTEIDRLYSIAGQSIYQKVTLIGDYLHIDPILISLMEILITWRNCTFHYDIDNQIREQSINCLHQNKDIIKKQFSGLDTDKITNTWEASGDFTFKETASLIRATQAFVNEIDAYILKNINYSEYYLDCIEKYWKQTPKSKIRFQSYTNEKRLKYIKELLKNIIGEEDPDINIIEELFIKLRPNLFVLKNK